MGLRPFCSMSLRKVRITSQGHTVHQKNWNLPHHSACSPTSWKGHAKYLLQIVQQWYNIPKRRSSHFYSVRVPRHWKNFACKHWFKNISNSVLPLTKRKISWQSCFYNRKFIVQLKWRSFKSTIYFILLDVNKLDNLSVFSSLKIVWSPKLSLSLQSLCLSLNLLFHKQATIQE